jgi:hypothetical protein
VAPKGFQFDFPACASGLPIPNPLIAARLARELAFKPTARAFMHVNGLILTRLMIWII